jgi:hypothetical protein
VYADGYRVRLVEALGSDYPALQGLIGEGAFDRMAREFIAAHPSRRPNLRWYGGELARFLARAPRWHRRSLLAELAQFEWALGLAFDAADASPATVNDVGRVPPEDWPAMRLKLDPSVQLLSLRSSAPLAWRAVIAGDEPPRPAMRRRPVDWLVWRKGHEPYYRALAPAEARALGAAAKGCRFDALCEEIERYLGNAQAAQRAAQFLKGWLGEGLICGIS